MLDILWLIFGLILLVGGTRITIEHAVVIARHHQLSDIFIGVAILALGSDLPELVVSVNAAVHLYTGTETSGVAIGNIIGSSFGQIGLCMGVVGLLGTLTLSRHYLFLHGGVLLGALIYLILVSLDGRITRIEGVLLLFAFVVYMVILFDSERRHKPPEVEVEAYRGMTWVWLLLGMIMVVSGSELTVRSTVSLAQLWGVSQSFIAIVILGIGTSLPELSISIAAVMRKRGGMSVGNLIGSNIFDSLVPVGAAATIHPLTVESDLVRFDLPALLAITLIVLIMFARRGMRRPEAIVLLVLYALYLLLKFAGF